MATSNSGFLGCGTVFLAPYIDNKKSNAWYDLDECDKFEIKENVSEKTRKSRKCDSYGQLASQVPIKEPVELSISFSSMNAENFSLLLMSNIEEISVPAGAFSENVVVKSGYSVHLDAKNIATLTVQSPDQATTYVEGDDYKISNSQLGFIEILKTGTIPDGEVLFGGTVLASSGKKMVGGSEYQRRFSVKLVGKNLDNGEPHTCIVHDVRLVPQSGVDFLADDFLVGELTGKPVLDPELGESYHAFTNVA